ncbi:M28 family peptidase [Anditalea andensis]|uniref:Peptidase M20 n=1 Tax=Anditalea andensis TaxID=1048983 RepID=A0A074L0Y1_9BACT|nr:M28 family peptidase [Anditalea andensis]KEO73513.1 peptidase M20 [Anditalea andensis]
MKYHKICILICTLVMSHVMMAQEVKRDRLMNDIKYLSSAELQGRKPLTAGSLLARKHIRQRFDHLGLSSQYTDHTQYFTFTGRGETTVYENAANIIGFIPGQESADIIVITAHYDHLGVRNEEIYHGADDNASGSAALLALAEYFSKNRPRHSIMFAALDGEEMGLQGAKALINDFPFPLEQIMLNINMDMISRNDKNELYATGSFHNPHLLPILQQVGREAPIKLRFGHDDPAMGSDDWTFSSDHAPFHLQKIPYIYFGVEDHDDYHKPTDTFENIDQEFYYNAVLTILRSVKAFDEALFTIK